MKNKETTPILLANTEWLPPEKLLKEVSSERMINSLIGLAKPELEETTVGDAECLAYVMPYTSRVRLTSDMTEIYFYLAGQVLKRWGQYDALPEECRVEKLDEWHTAKMEQLKKWIYKQRGGEYKNPVISALKEVFFFSPSIKSNKE